MPLKEETTWECPAQTRVKHEILKGYLNAWFPILGMHNGRIVYIDGFAGPGSYSTGEKGSPLIALEAAKDQAKYLTGAEVRFLFIEKHPERLKNLQETIDKEEKPSNFLIDIQPGGFEECCTEILDHLDAGQARNAPMFAFIDPFGFSGVSYDILRRLLKRDRIEVFVYFARNSVNRFIEVDKVEHHMQSLFGLDEIIIPDGVNRLDYVKSLYEKQLKKIAKYVGCFTMYTKNNQPNYDLFFASNNPLGYIKMKEAMWRVDDTGNFKFSQRHIPNQIDLFLPDPLPPLRKIILELGGHQKNINVNLIEKYVNEQTIYLSKHMKAVLKKLEEENLIEVQKVKSDGTPRRGRFFAENTMINFA